jgi:hypothetical protein
LACDKKAQQSACSHPSVHETAAADGNSSTLLLARQAPCHPACPVALKAVASLIMFSTYQIGLQSRCTADYKLSRAGVGVAASFVVAAKHDHETLD